MSLLRYTLRYLSISLIVVLTIWAAIFYFSMLDEVYDSLDDGLENYKLLIIDRAQKDPAVIHHTSFQEGNYYVEPISKESALATKDFYRDSTIYTINEKDFEPVRVLTTTFDVDDHYYKLTVMSSMVEEDDLVEDLFFAIVWLYVLLLLVIILTHQYMLKIAWSPFFKMIDRLKAFRLGHDDEIGEMDVQVREFKQLKQSIDMLISSSNEAYHQQKVFIENAAHELQTPLAIGINKLELLAERIENEDVLMTIGQVNEELLRLKRLNRSLLHLSKIENSQFDEVEDVNINELLKEHLDDFTALAEFNEVELRMIEHEECVVRMNLDLAKMLTTNLLKNAIIHNVKDGAVEVIIDRYSLQFINSGVGESLDVSRLFKRFYKGDNNVGNTGLGLSIVKTIAAYCKFEIGYRFLNNTHQFTLRF